MANSFLPGFFRGMVIPKNDPSAPPLSRAPLPFKRRLLFLGMVILLFLLLLEGGLRLGGFRHHIPREHIRFPGIQTHLRERKSIIRFSSSIFWELNPGIFFLSDESPCRINSLGFRGEEVSTSKPVHTFRICCLGDSCTFGLKVKEEEAYPACLQKCLSERGAQKFQVVNCGVPGYSSFQGLIQLKTRILGLDPDLITLYFGFNDMTPAVKYSDREAHAWEQSLPARILAFFSGLRIFQLAFKTVKGKDRESPPKDGTPPPRAKRRVSPKDFLSNVSAILESAGGKGIKVILLASPLSSEGGKPARILDKRYNRTLRYLADSQARIPGAGIALVDLPRILSGLENGQFFLDPVHPSPAGHRIIAKRLMEKMEEMGILE